MQAHPSFEGEGRPSIHSAATQEPAPFSNIELGTSRSVITTQHFSGSEFKVDASLSRRSRRYKTSDEISSLFDDFLSM
jgi:hypothetical protein